MELIDELCKLKNHYTNDQEVVKAIFDFMINQQGMYKFQLDESLKLYFIIIRC